MNVQYWYLTIQKAAAPFLLNAWMHVTMYQRGIEEPRMFTETDEYFEGVEQDAELKGEL